MQRLLQQFLRYGAFVGQYGEDFSLPAGGMCFRTPAQYMAAHMHQFAQIAGLQTIAQLLGRGTVPVMAMIFVASLAVVVFAVASLVAVFAAVVLIAVVLIVAALVAVFAVMALIMMVFAAVVLVAPLMFTVVFVSAMAFGCIMALMIAMMFPFRLIFRHTLVFFRLNLSVFSVSAAASQRIQRAMSIALIAVSCHNSSSFLDSVPK